MIDNYGQPVPADLVVIDFAPEDSADLARVIATKWYRVDDLLLASAAAVGDIYSGAPEDYGLDLGVDCIPLRIPEALKRVNEDGMFYHA